MLAWIIAHWPVCAILIVSLSLLLMISYHLRRANTLKQAKLILKMSDSFAMNGQIQSMYTKLEQSIEQQGYRLQQELTGADRPLIAAYLNYWMMVYQLYHERAIGFKHIDPLFALPFFLGINHRYIQQYLLNHDDHYRTVITLYERWLAYRRKYKLGEPFSEQSLSLQLGRRKI